MTDDVKPGPRHHPGEESLIRFAAGHLPAGHALVVSAHLGFCPDCRDTAAFCESLGGALLTSEDAARLPDGALSQTLSRLDGPATGISAAAPGDTLLPGFPPPRWRWVAPGLKRALVDIQGAMPHERAYLLRVTHGRSMPAHGHRGWEATCVLAGHFTDSTGTYHRGDVAEIMADLSHQPIAGGTEDCICLIASEFAPRMRGLLPRLARAFAGV